MLIDNWHFYCHFNFMLLSFLNSKLNFLLEIFTLLTANCIRIFFKISELRVCAYSRNVD
jgi:hypothetical protein